jgi:hypothetical protein
MACKQIVMRPMTPTVRALSFAPSTEYHQMTISETVESQLKYDTARRKALAALSESSLLTMLQALSDMAMIVPSEPYYIGAEPDSAGGCPWCPKTFSRYDLSVFMTQKKKLNP